MRLGTTLLGIAFAAAVGAAVLYSAGINAPKAEDRPVVKPTVHTEELENVPLGISPSRGPADAPVTIVEFSELGCAFCGRADAVMKVIAARYASDIRFVWKARGASTDPAIAFATELLLSAPDDAKFWTLHERFALASAVEPITDAKVREAVSALGLDPDALFGEGRGRARLAEDRALADRLHVQELPVFFVNGVRISGVADAAAFEKAIAAAKERAKNLVESGVAKSEVYAELMRRAAADPRQLRPNVRPRPSGDARQNVQLVAHAPMRGGKEPRVVIVEFSDFQCAACAGAGATFDELLAQYGDSLAIEFRNLPVQQHPRALPAAKAAMAAHLQGAFWKYHDLLFANPNALAEEDLRGYAEKLKLDLARFDRDRALSAIDGMLSRDAADAATFGVRGTPTFFINGLPVRGAQTIAVLKATIDAELARAGALIDQGVAPRDVYAALLRTEPSAQPTPAIDVKTAPRKGSADAKVEVIVFSDFECPACRTLAPSLDQLAAKSDVAIVYKQYPLPIHRNAELAAVASVAAQRQGKFWEMHDRLYAHQDELSREQLIEHARALGLDVDRFTKDLDDREVRGAVKNDIAEGVRLGITATPTMFVAGRRVEGAKPYEELSQLVETALRAAL